MAACGFTPAYGPEGPGTALRGQITLAEPSDRDGFEFRNRLEDRLGRAQGATRYRMNYSIATEPVGAGVQPSGAITRYTLRGKAKYVLVTEATGQTAASGVVESFTSWSTSGSTVATLASEEDANRRLMIILADQVVARVLAAAPK